MKKLFFSLLLLSTLRVIGQQPVYPYQDTSLTFEQRAADLVNRMTVSEKILQMQFDAPAIPRLGIPYYNWSGECLHGIVNEGGYATVFPQAIGMAATWDTALIRKEADIISTEARAWYYRCIENNDIQGVHKSLTFWSPNINIFRDPRWGRGQETYGEDPYLTSLIGVAFVHGLQGNNPKYLKIVSTPKHYAVHSGPEPLRHAFNAVASRRDLFETYLPAFEACIRQGGAYSVMGAYSAYEEVPCCASHFLLNDMLRKSWGFRGYVVSDCGAIGDIYTGHKFTPDAATACAAAVKAGCDITCGGEYVALQEALDRGLITEKEIDQSVTRLMLARMKLGMFDPPAIVPYASIKPADIELKSSSMTARDVARESIVLLKNQDNLLPLDRKKLKTVAVIGPYIMRDDILYGNYSGFSSHPVTFLQGIRNKLGNDVQIEYTKGVPALDQGGALTTVPADFVTPPNGEGHGLKGDYFNNPDLKGKPVFSRIDSNMASYWDKNSPAEGVPADNFSVRWSGTITPPETGTYLLGIVTDDRGRFYFEDKLVVDNWSPCQLNVMKTFRAKMEKGKQYKIVIEYADSVDYAGIRFQWKRDDLDDELLTTPELHAKALAIAAKSDVIIMYAGISANLEGEEMMVNEKGFKGGDRTSLDLPENQQKLIRELYATGKPVVLVLTSGSALSVNWENENISAIAQVWYPGQEGGNAVADILFGDYNPAGRLPVTFYKSVNDLPAFDDYNTQGRTYRYFNGKPLFPFGYGLSYTKFEYSGLQLSSREISADGSVQVNVTIKNTGSCDGDEAPQLYVTNVSSKENQPIRSLKGFTRIHLNKGGSKTVTFTLKASDLKYYSEKKNDFVVEPGQYDVQVGASSADIRARQTLTVN